jgi:hypothetical protein
MALAGTLLLIAVPVAAISTGEFEIVFKSDNGWFPEERPDNLFPDSTCQVEPITYYEPPMTARGVKYVDWSVDVTGVASDLDPNTYILCNSDENAALRCIVGFSNGTSIGCRDRVEEPTSYRKVSEGDLVVLRFDAKNAESCRIKIVDQGALFRDADPKCRRAPQEPSSSPPGLDLGY